MCDIFDYANLVKTATCHTKNVNPTLIDVILTNKPSYFFFIGICLSIISIKDVSNFEYALFTSSSAIWFSK
jgi:hypothetical protein